MDGIPAIAEDLRDLLNVFVDHEVRFLVVGGYALAVHGHPRATGDGLPPLRIDILTNITGVNSSEAWPDRLGPEIDGLVVPVIGRDALLANKRALGRTRDLADVEMLEADHD
jgi:hypothetical protein